MFNLKVDRVLTEMGLTPCHHDPCVDRKEAPEKMILALFVDDGILAAENEELVDEFLETFKKTSRVTDKPLAPYLGLHIETAPDRSGIRIHQSR